MCYVFKNCLTELQGNPYTLVLSTYLPTTLEIQFFRNRLPSSFCPLLCREPSWSCHSEVTCIKLAFVYVCHLKVPPPQGKKEVSYCWGDRSYKKCISKFGPEFQNRNCGHFSYCHPVGSSSVNALSTVRRGVSFRQTGFIIAFSMLIYCMVYSFSLQAKLL